MEIIKESPAREKKVGRGRMPKYPFSNLSPGDCLKIKAANYTEYHRIMCALGKFKKYNSLNWDTTTRFNNGIVSIYRLS